MKLRNLPKWKNKHLYHIDYQSVMFPLIKYIAYKDKAK